jgi:hypothetical protein
MNAAVRAVVRGGITAGAEVYGIYEGWQGAVDGGHFIRPMSWEDVSGIMIQGGTVIGTARCAAFRTPEGRRTAVLNLIRAGIDRLVVIGGDGSLTGTDVLRDEWPAHIDALLEEGRITPQDAADHPTLRVAGLVGSIDNDMVGTDMTIGTDSALHRITEAIDAIASTAASPPAQLRRRGHGTPLRLSGPDERDRRWRRLRVHPRASPGPGLARAHGEGAAPRAQRRTPLVHRRRRGGSRRPRGKPDHRGRGEEGALR